MSFKDKYCLEAESTKPENKHKMAISPESFAVCELLEKITLMLKK